MSSAGLSALVRRALGYSFSADTNNLDDDTEERFPRAKYDRTTQHLWLVCVAVAVVSSDAFWYGLNNYGASPWWLLLVMVVSVSVSVGWFCLSFFRWSRDYTYDKDGGKVPGVMYRFSIRGGTINDPYVDADNRMRTCILSASNLPITANHKNFIWRCSDIDDRHIIFDFFIYSVFGGYDFLKDNAGRISAEFGDPDGAELKKVGANHYQLILDQLDASAGMSANVAWGDEDPYYKQQL